MSRWDSEAIALAARRFGENDAILDVFTRDKGRMSALVYGGNSTRKRALLEPGSRLTVSWTARNDAQLGYFEALESRGTGPAALMDDAAALTALNCVAALLRDVTPERALYPALFDATDLLLGALEETQIWPALYIRWEMGLLAELGFGLDLSKCALSGATDDLVWVSPKSGRAASRTAGEPYQDRLLALPQFLLSSQNGVQAGDVADGFALTGHFITRELLDPMRRTMPEPRARLIFALGKSGRL